MTNIPQVLTSLAAVMTDIHAVGIEKVRKNKEQNFNFRGIDEAIGAFAPLLDKHSLLVTPSYSNLVTTARATKSGGNTYNAQLEGRFSFVSTKDGSQHTVGPFFGEANDGQDKAVSKATSIAYRNALFLTFCVPHEPAIGGDPDGQGEPEDDGSSDWLADWLATISAAGTNEELQRIGDELKSQEPTIDALAMNRIRRAWAERARVVQVAT